MVDRRLTKFVIEKARRYRMVWHLNNDLESPLKNQKKVDKAREELFEAIEEYKYGG